jgi:hypothetical protein
MKCRIIPAALQPRVTIELRVAKFSILFSGDASRMLHARADSY